jgi:hypothetical protein
MGWRDLIMELCPSCGPRLDLLIQFLPTDFNGWFALFGQLVGLLWVLYQFNKLREDTEAKLQEYLEKHLERKRKRAVEDRDRMLKRIASPKRSGIASELRYMSAQVQFFGHAVTRFIPFFGKPNPERLALILLSARDDRRAAEAFSRHAAELLKQAKLYDEESKAKKIAAGNAYIFSGRLSANTGDGQAARDAFQKTLDESDKNDLDAREQITMQYLETKDLILASDHCGRLINLAKRLGDKRLPQYHRLQAKILLAQTSARRAFTAMREALRLDEEQENSAGLARDYEGLGDVQASRSYRKAAEQSYTKSAALYLDSDEQDGATAVKRKLASVTKTHVLQETWRSIWLRRLAEFMQAKAEQYRVPA